MLKVVFYFGLFLFCVGIIIAVSYSVYLLYLVDMHYGIALGASVTGFFLAIIGSDDVKKSNKKKIKTVQ